MSRSEKIVEAIRENSRYHADYFDRAYAPDIRELVAELPTTRWVGVACLPISAIGPLITERAWVHASELGLGAGSTESGRTVYAQIDVMAVDPHDVDQDAVEYNRTSTATDTWVVLVMEKDPRSSAFATDRDLFGRTAWEVFPPSQFFFWARGSQTDCEQILAASPEEAAMKYLDLYPEVKQVSVEDEDLHKQVFAF